MRAHFVGQGFDFGEIAAHFAPALPERVIGIRMDGTLEGPHAVFHGHDEQLLLDYRRRIVEREHLAVELKRGGEAVPRKSQ